MEKPSSDPQNSLTPKESQSSEIETKKESTAAAGKNVDARIEVEL